MMFLSCTERLRRKARLAAVVAVVVAGAACVRQARAEDSSSPAMLQLFEARWSTIEDRMADIFQVGYGRMWLPPPTRADSGNTSVGYDVYDRFDLGKPRNETLYGTETSLKTLVSVAHSANVLVNTDFIANHDGFSDSSTVDNRGTSDPLDDVTFVQAGGYPGFVVTMPGDVDGDFHGAFEGGQENSRLAGLIDIAQEKNYQFIRSPVSANNPQNIPAGTQGVFGRPPANVPDPNNARFYPDQALGGTTVYDPRFSQNVTLYNFNTANPLAGDAVSENATGLLMRNARWMVQEIGVDGFRYDAGRHFPRWVLDYLDQALFRSKQQTLLDGSPQQTFSFAETGYDSASFIQPFIRKDIDNNNSGQVGGNRDVLDFNLFGALNGNLTGNGLQNNWHNIRNASIDLNDDGLRNGSQGVAFAQSHDELGPFLQNVAYAYILMMPGNALVYENAHEFGTDRQFPRGGKDDALGGYYGNTITKLVDLRNSYGRGDYRERWLDDAFNPNGFSNIYVYERSKSVVVGLNSRVDDGYDERQGVQTDFAPGTILVELTGNANDPIVDPGGNIPETVKVNNSGQITIRIPRNQYFNTNTNQEEVHGRGYVMYGVARPQGALSLSNRGTTQVLAGTTPTAANNGTVRLADIDVVTSNSFTVRLNTTPVSLADPDHAGQFVRDVHADGDQATIKIDGGLNINGGAGIDDVTPGSVGYGFENFVTTRTPGYIWSGGTNVGMGSGTYAQAIDTTLLSEGRHYITVRAFRHRDSSTGGDGGPAVFTDFKRTIYVDRLPPVSAVVSFDPYASNPGNPNNRDLIVRSVDQTANSMHVLLDLPAGLSQSQILAQLGGSSQASYYDRDQFVHAFTNLPTGSHVATVVTYEPTGNFNIQRFTGLYTATNIGAGFGDMDSSGTYTVGDIRCNGPCSNFSAEDVLYSQNAKFRAAFDVNGDGLGDNRDLFALGIKLVAGGASQVVLDSYTDLLLKRGDFDSSGTTGTADMLALYSHFGAGTWLYDMNVDGVVNSTDVSTMISDVFRTKRGDFNLDGSVDGADYVLMRKNMSIGTKFTQGDADLDGDVDATDALLWQSNFGFVRQPLSASGSGAQFAAVPEVATLMQLVVAMAVFGFTTAARLARRVYSS
jgi:alpha-amylase